MGEEQDTHAGAEGPLQLTFGFPLRLHHSVVRMNHYRFSVRRLLAALVVAHLVAVHPAVPADDLAPLPVKPPAPTLKGTPSDLPSGPNVEPPPDKEKPRPPFLAPKGVINVAAGRRVTSSSKPFTGVLAQLTDGLKEPEDDQVVEMRRGKQWVQIDLGEPARIYAIVIWHDHRFLQVFHDVIVQVADDPDFTRNVKTIFNNDVDNSAGLGIGTDKEYFETNQGRTFDAQGVVSRYVRCYTAGSSLSALNVCQEIEVYGLLP
jgi:hypothetical protein